MKVLYGIFFIIFFQSHIFADEIITIAVRENFSLTRLYVQVLTEAYRRIGQPVEFISIPGGSSLKYSNNGYLGVDGEAGRLSGVLKQNKNLRPVPVAIYNSELTVFTNKKDLKISGWEDLKQYQVTTRIGYKLVRNKLAGENLRVVENSSMALMLVEKQRSDVAILSKVDGIAVINKLQLKNIIMLDTPVQTSPVFHLINKDKQYLIPRLEKALEDMRQKGVLQEMAGRFESEFIKVD
ncbi:MAG: transporter substrate-binding domain-containing protein [Gammaproteobacteria bacterium]|nr:transporter substrate-binding domain-containing protein [Gammaproteobacteria bacterium]